MAGIRVIRQRIKSAKNIAQISRAMQMVAASKMKRAQQEAINGKPYAEKIYQAVSELTKITDSEYHQLLTAQKAQGKTLVILISTNKGLCGSLNTNLFRKCLNWFTPPSNFDFITLGIKGSKFVLRGRFGLLADFSQKTPFTQYVPAVIDLVIKKFLEGIYKQVLVVYNSFINALNIVPEKKLILPMSEIGVNIENREELPAEFLIEPSPVKLLDTLLPHYLETLVRNAIIQSEASEHSARMLAMKNATDNALSLQEELTLVYNKLRQEQITYEIADITRAQLSLKH